MSTLRRLSCLLVGLIAAGCAGEFATDPQSPWGNTSSNSGVYWTIRCIELRGADSEADAQRIADSLRSTRGIEAGKVFVRNDSAGSVVYYGKYLRTPDGDTGKFKIPLEMQRDAIMIKELTANEGGRFFFDSRPVPIPTPDPGPPEWQLANNPGTYSLRIAVFFDEPGFYKRKEAAVALCQELREKNYASYYRHSEFVSEVFVGQFGPEARVRGRKSGVVAFLNSTEVQQLQRCENGQFAYELWNMKMRTLKSASGQSNQPMSTGPDRRVVYLSRLFPVHEDLDTVAEDNFY